MLKSIAADVSGFSAIMANAAALNSRLYLADVRNCAEIIRTECAGVRRRTTTWQWRIQTNLMHELYLRGSSAVLYFPDVAVSAL